MNLSGVVFLAFGLSAAFSTLATDKNHGVDSRHALSQCMLRQMRADQHESYLEAQKSCKDRLASSAARRQPTMAMNESGGAPAKRSSEPPTGN